MEAAERELQILSEQVEFVREEVKQFRFFWNRTRGRISQLQPKVQNLKEELREVGAPNVYKQITMAQARSIATMFNGINVEMKEFLTVDEILPICDLLQSSWKEVVTKQSVELLCANLTIDHKKIDVTTAIKLVDELEEWLFDSFERSHEVQKQPLLNITHRPDSS